MTNPINLLHRSEINSDCWNDLIVASPDGRLYASTRFLDCMAPGWMALVQGDYEYVMPLPVRKRLGFTYIFQPAFCQQLGVFGKTRISKEVNDAFLSMVKKHYSYAEINAHSHFPLSSNAFTVRKNYLLDLHPSFEDLEKKFSRSALRNIKKATDLDVSIAKHPDASDLVDLYEKRYGLTLTSREDLEGIKKYFDYSVKVGTGHFYYAKTSDGQTVASSGYLTFKNRVTFLMSGNLQAGLHCGATHLLKARAIQNFAGKELFMDFEGSDNPDFARFYEQYGATESDNYPFFVLNNLPQPLKWFKRRQLKKLNLSN